MPFSITYEIYDKIDYDPISILGKISFRRYSNVFYIDDVYVDDILISILRCYNNLDTNITSRYEVDVPSEPDTIRIENRSDNLTFTCGNFSISEIGTNDFHNAVVNATEQFLREHAELLNSNPHLQASNANIDELSTQFEISKTMIIGSPYPELLR